MVEPIQSREKFGLVRVERGEAPKHVLEGHETCAFYPVTEPFDHFSLLVGMRCQHEVDASGAFYNEDYLRRLKELSYQLIEHFEILDKNKKGPFTGDMDQFEPFYEFQNLTVQHWEFEIMGGWIAELRKLTK